MSKTAPVLLLAWRRPDTVRETIASIRVAAPERLYVACDGPDSFSMEQIEKVAETRRIIDKEIDWDCQVSKLYADVNQGCRFGVGRAISWFFEHEPEGIILEDDCVPHADFFRFCSDLLRFYRQNDRVWCITGDNFQHGTKRGKSSYYFSKYPHCWGWATWRRSWMHYSPQFEFWPLWKRSKHWRNVVSNRHERAYWERVFDGVYEKRTDSWALPWMACVWKSDGLTATPQVNLVQNIGFGHDASHTKTSNSALIVEAHGLKAFNDHPVHVTADLKADEYVFKTVFRGGGIRRTMTGRYVGKLWQSLRALKMHLESQKHSVNSHRFP